MPPTRTPATAGKTTGSTSGRTTGPGRARARGAADDLPAEPTAAVGRQTVTELRLPGIALTVSRDHTAAEAAGPHSRLRKVAVYGGIAALGAFEVVEWPVALGIGAGTYLVRRLTGHTGPPPENGSRRDGNLPE